VVVKREAMSPAGEGRRDSSNRASIIQVSQDKRAKKVKFYINGDKFFKGAVIAVSQEKFRTFDKLLEHLTRIMCNQVTLPNGVRVIYSIEGRQVTDVDCLLNDESYVCSSTTTFKKLDYLSLGTEEQAWNRVSGMKRDTYYLGMRNGGGRRERATTSKSFVSARSSVESERVQIKPRIITVLRSGTRPRKAVRVLLNNRNTKSLDMVLADLTITVRLDTGAVRKLFTLSGSPVNSLLDLGDEEVFIAYGVDKASQDDFDLDLIEFRNVQAILKSQKLDLKYEKFAHMSPKTSRKKFLNSRVGVGRSKRGNSKSRQNGVGGLKNGSSFHAIEDIAETWPGEVTEKYHLRQVVGDGNFAVVRVCYSRLTRKEFAVKIIDKAKCQGKEHMIESEISILTAIDHPNIIQLEEVFDFPGEKYLVMEYVQVFQRIYLSFVKFDKSRAETCLTR
jgi:doublecortin-like kinase 1/2